MKLAAIMLSIIFTLILADGFFGSSNKIELNEEEILVITKNAYLKGYEATLLNKDVDSSWSVISKTYNISKLKKIQN